MDIEEIRQLARLMKESDLGRLEVEDGDRRIVLEAKNQALSLPVAYSPAAASAPGATPGESAVSAQGSAMSDLCAQTSPLVGTVYLAAQSGSPPYVKVGDRVNKGDTLCLLESMKMFNEFRADRSGKVAEICVTNGQIVDFGQNLFMLRLEGSAGGS
jgi:acetyl-CoA carboxylase biotin carboxyl carrier protein